ncbi:hypothetical protein DV736_g1750, partial [Chaetothyriales sp. CBS 134916]
MASGCLDHSQLAAASVAPPSSPRIDLPDLPEDVILLVLQHLQIWEIVHCQCVSRAWSKTFSNESYLKTALKRYPGAHEVRALNALHSLALHSIQWKALAQSVASRYYHLSHGKVRDVSHFSLFAAEQVGQYYPVGQWEHHESQPSGRLYYENAAPHLGGMQIKPYLFRQTLWTYSDGLLVFAPVPADEGSRNEFMLSLLDLSTSQQVQVPFSVSDKIVRNIRLTDHILLIEWAERNPFHSLNDMEQVNRHFVTCFDVKFDQYSLLWVVEFRSEFKIHFLGLPLNSKDRFLSTHNAKHYVVYFFQPNRSMYTGGEERPIESLFVWDISRPSPYLPSADPSGENRPPPGCGPTVVARFPFNRLDELGVRQHNQIKLMSLGIDSEGCHVIWRENICEAAYGYFDPAERDWRAKTTIFPFFAHGPHRYKRREGYLPPYRGHASMESCDIEVHAIEKWFVPVMDVLDNASGVRFSLVETCFTGLGVEQRMVVRVKVPCLGESGEYVILRDDALVKEVTAMGRIAGDERYLVGMNDNMELVVCRF